MNGMNGEILIKMQGQLIVGNWFTDLLLEGVSALGSLFNTLLEWILGGILTSFSETILSFGEGLYNSTISSAIGALTMSPEEWAGGVGWQLIESINIIFIAFAVSLVVVFFLIGFFAMITDTRHQIRVETILMLFIRLSVTTFFVVFTKDIVRILFQIPMGLMGTRFNLEAVGADGTLTRGLALNLSELIFTGHAAEIEAMTFPQILLMALLSVITALGFVMVGVLVCYQAYMRFFKILCIVPYGAIAASTLAGDHTIAMSAVSFYKYVIGTVFEAVTMMIAICLYVAVANSGSMALLPPDNINNILLNNLMLAFLLLGTIKGAAAITNKALSL